MFTGLFIDSVILTPYIEQAKSEIVWSIPAGPSAFYSPNILSELIYRDVKSRGLGFNVARLKRVSENWAIYIEGDYSDSSIISGRAQDSDYLGDDRTQEFSRSYADIEDDSNSKKSLVMGIKTRWFYNKGHYLTAFIGRQKYDLNMTVTNGVQYIPEELRGTRLTGLNTTFNSELDSYLWGIATEHVFGWGTVGLRYERHNVEYDAVANWNLREDLAHPVSFIQTGEGKGNSITFSYTKQINPNWDAFFNYTLRSYEIEGGYDQIFLADGRSYVTTLNEFKYDSESIQIGVRYILY